MSDFLARIEARATLRELFKAAYPDPDGTESLEEHQREQHADIPSLALDALDAERIVARIRWALEGERASDWLRERLARLDSARARRR